MLLFLASLAASAAPALVPGAPLWAGQPGTVVIDLPGLVADSRVKAVAADARVDDVTRLSDERVAVHVTPRSAGDLTLQLTIRGPAGKDEGTVVVAVVPAPDGGLELRPDPTALTYGQARSVALTITPRAPSARPSTERDLRLQSSLGRLAAAQTSETGWTSTWTPPKGLDAPAFAILAAADAAAPASTPGWVAFPVSVDTALTFSVEAGAICTLQAGELTAGPVTASGDGQLKMRVALHPAVARGDLTCTAGGQELHRAVPLPAGQDPWPGWLPLPARVPAGATIPIQLVVVEDDGSPRLSGSLPQVEVARGTATALAWVGHGLASGTFTAPNEPGGVRLSATLRDRVVETTVEVVEAGSLSAAAPIGLVGFVEGEQVVVAAVDDLGLPVAANRLALPEGTVRVGKDGRARVAAGTTLSYGALSATVPLETGPDQLLALQARLADPTRPVPLPVPADADVALQATGIALAPAEETGGRVRVEQPPRETPWARIAVLAATVPHSYHLSSSGQEGVPAELDADQGDLFRGQIAGAPALHLRGVAQRDSWPLAIDADLSGRYEGYVVNDTDFTRIDLQAALGARLPMVQTERWRPYLLVQGELFTVPIFTYDSFREESPEKSTGAKMLTSTLPGARLGAGVDIVFGDLQVELEASETFAWWPVHTRVDAGLAWAASDLVGLRAGLELGFRSFTFDLETEEAQVRDQQHALSAGLVFLLR